jgi:hypothetical protein
MIILYFLLVVSVIALWLNLYTAEKSGDNIWIEDVFRNTAFLKKLNILSVASLLFALPLLVLAWPLGVLLMVFIGYSHNRFNYLGAK